MQTLWTVDLAGRTYTLIPRHDVLVAAEQALGEPLYAALMRAEASSFTLAELGVLCTALVLPSEPERAAGAGPSRLQLDYAAMQMGGASGRGLRFSLAPAIFEAGALKVTAALAKPLTMAVLGKLKADGTPKDDAEAGATTELSAGE